MFEFLGNALLAESALHVPQNGGFEAVFLRAMAAHFEVNFDLGDFPLGQFAIEIIVEARENLLAR